MRLSAPDLPDRPLDTRDRILDAAERHFAERGFELATLRAVTADAGVNLAAVNYHFGTKERLFEAVLARLIGPVNEQRLARLDALEARGNPSLEELIEAFVAPALGLASHQAGVACVLLGRCMSSPDEQTRALLLRLFGGVLDRFIAAFSRALPHLPPDEVLWRTFFMLGVMTQTMSCGHHLKFVSGGACDPADVEQTVPRIVRFAAAAMREPREGQ